MPKPKAAVPAPIDRPLSKAYLREFKGWSTALSPGLSDPSTLRQSENVLIGRDGSARIRPALRNVFGDYWVTDKIFAGAWETYYDEDGKRILFPMRDEDGVWTFWSSAYDGDKYLPPETLETAGFPVGSDAAATFTNETMHVKMLQMDNKIFVLSDAEPLFIINVGATKSVKVFDAITDVPDVPVVNLTTITATGTAYHYLVFITYTNELGETKPSPIVESFVSALSPVWAAGSKITVTPDATDLADAITDGATGYNVYFVEWSSSGVAPVEALQVGVNIAAASFDITPAVLMSADSSRLLPNPNDINSARPVVCGNGLVAADRLILVQDKDNSARVRWSANETGFYGSMDTAHGGGYKTLTHGELQIPAAVALWQNPQSVDTLTILNEGVDSYSTSYYMAPATITSQSESTQIMSFEQTNGTPGTVAPFGVRAYNNGLYHPLDDMLMKSSANNYNISHKNMTEAIRDRWQLLRNKHHIHVEEFDGRLYYIVDNPDGVNVPDGCHGNEVWVLDAMNASDGGGAWSRLLIPGNELKRIELHGRIHMAVVRPESIYFLDELAFMDENPEGETAIPWFLQTNTQGVNRQHDQDSRLQQVTPTFGNFFGTCRYGISAWDVDGKAVDLNKVYRQPVEVDFSENPLPWDHEDPLLIRKGIQEFYFNAGSIEDKDGVTLPSYGQISNVQYRMMPLSTNVGYERGSNETYEYRNAGAAWQRRTAINGVPIPEIDPRRP
jgi:hypothetical protein